MYSNEAVLGSLNKESNMIELLRPSEDSKPGDIVYLDGSQIKSNLSPMLNASRQKEIYDLLKTDDNAFACFNNNKLRTQTGFVRIDFLKMLKNPLSLII